MTKEKFEELTVIGKEIRPLNEMISNIERFLHNVDHCSEISLYKNSSYNELASLELGKCSCEKNLVDKFVYPVIRDCLLISVDRLKAEQKRIENIIKES